jgi:hypothetical protein
VTREGGEAYPASQLMLWLVSVKSDARSASAVALVYAERREPKPVTSALAVLSVRQCWPLVEREMSVLAVEPEGKGVAVVRAERVVSRRDERGNFILIDEESMEWGRAGQEERRVCSSEGLGSE